MVLKFHVFLLAKYSGGVSMYNVKWKSRIKMIMIKVWSFVKQF